MTVEQIQALLPPIVLSIGGILPFLVSSTPFSIVENARMLLICNLTLVIWLGYWGAYAFGDWIFVSQASTVVFVFLALALFFALFFVAQRPAQPKKDASGSPVLDPAGKPVMELSIDKPYWIWAYVLGLLFVSVAAALYVGPKDRVVIEFEWPDASHGGLSGEAIQMTRDLGNGAPVSLELLRRSNPAKFMMTKEEFGQVKTFEVTVRPSDPNGADRHFEAAPSTKTELLRPGLGQHFRLHGTPH